MTEAERRFRRLFQRSPFEVPDGDSYIGDGFPMDCDSVLVFSFGRNTCPDRLIYCYLLASGLDRASDDSTIFGQMTAHKFDAGLPNKSIAERVGGFLNSERIGADFPVVAQWEIAYLLWTRKLTGRVLPVYPKEEEYLGTIQVAEEFVRMARENGWKRPLVVCHPAMLGRVITILWKLGVRPMGALTSEHNYDGQSKQPWTRSRVSFAVWEILAKLHHMIYKRVSFQPPEE